MTVALGMYEPEPLAVKRPGDNSLDGLCPLYWVLTKINNGLRMDGGQFQKLIFMRANGAPESQWETLSDYVALRSLIAFNAGKAGHPVGTLESRGVFDGLIALEDLEVEAQVNGLYEWCKKHRIEVKG